MTVGTASYCSACGHRYSDAPAPRSLDMQARPAREFHQSRRSATLDLRPTAAPKAEVTHTAKTPAAAPAHTAHERQAAAVSAKLAAAQSVQRSPHIQRFPRQATQPTVHQTSPVARSAAPAVTAPHKPETVPAPVKVAEQHQPLPNHTVTQHEGLKHLAKTKPNRPRYQFLPQPARVLTVMAAIFIMGSYVWLQNSPKLALQTASTQAGITASLPGYLPSSYSLSGTDTGPGLVSLNFKSPSIPEILKINQHRTNWDSASLLDNFVAKQADDYSTIHGQGLTIYIFGQNRASWVNQGIWYNIEGATHLSREQLLKIALSF